MKNIFWIVALLFTTNQASALQLDLPHSVSQVNAEGGGLSKVEMVQVQGGEFSFVDYELVKILHPQTVGMTDSQIQKFLYDCCISVSKLQLKLQGIRNTKIPYVKDKEMQTFRNQFHGRNGLNEIQGASPEDTALLDVKGNGVGGKNGERNVRKMIDMYEKYLKISDKQEREKKLNELRNLSHSDGLMSHGEAVAELSRQRAIQMLLDERNVMTDLKRYETLEILFIYRLPFGIIKPNGEVATAALCGRQPSVDRQKLGESTMKAHELPYLDEMGKGQHDGRKTPGLVDTGAVMVTDKKGRLNPNFTGVLGDGPLPTSRDGSTKFSYDPLRTKPVVWGYETAEYQE